MIDTSPYCTCQAVGCHHPAPSLPLTFRLHAYGVCDDPEYFYGYIDGLIKGVVSGVRAEAVVPPARDLLRLIQAKGVGYAISTQEELKTIKVEI